jgi:hypothetical protein
MKYVLASQRARRAFVVDTGATTRTTGNTAAQWKFARETTQRKKLKFHALSTCDCDVILSYEYHRKHRKHGTVDTNWHRIESQEVDEELVPPVDILGFATHSVVGTFEKEHAIGLPGTGCETKLISE